MTSAAFTLPPGERPPLTITTRQLLAMLAEQPAELCRWLGGVPWGLVCRPEQARTYQPIALHYGLRLIPSDECKEEGFVLIHAGESARWVKAAKEIR